MLHTPICQESRPGFQSKMKADNNLVVLSRHFHCESATSSSDSSFSSMNRYQGFQKDMDESGIDEERLCRDNSTKRRDQALLQRVDVLQSAHRRRPDTFLQKETTNESPAANRATASPMSKLHATASPMSKLHATASPMSKLRATTSPTSTGGAFSMPNDMTGSQSNSPPLSYLSPPSQKSIEIEPNAVTNIINEQQKLIRHYQNAQKTTAPFYHHDSSLQYANQVANPWYGPTVVDETLKTHEMLTRHVLQRPDPNCLPKRVLANLMAYWLSLKYEQSVLCEKKCNNSQFITLQDLCNPNSTSFVPSYLRNGTFLKQILTDICWSSGAKALDRIGAVHTVENIGAYSSPAQLQCSLQQFINTIGAAAIQSYLEANTNWTVLTQRYRCMLSARAGNIREMLQTMSLTAFI